MDKILIDRHQLIYPFQLWVDWKKLVNMSALRAQLQHWTKPTERKNEKKDAVAAKNG